MNANLLRHAMPGTHAVCATEETTEKDIPLAKRISGLTVPEKIRLALTGNKEARTLLYREGNKMVTQFILQNPRIMEDEVLYIAKDRNAPEEIIAAIVRRKEWMKKYHLRLAVTFNPKTPVPMALNIMRTLRDGDLRKIVKSKDVSSYLVAGARRLLASKGLM